MSAQPIDLQNQVSKRVQQNKSSVSIFDFSSFEMAERSAKKIFQSSLVNKKTFKSDADVLIAVQYGFEIGLSLMQALRGICVINGQPSLYGDTVLALCYSHKEFEYCDELYDETTMTWTCKVKRADRPEVVRTFSKAKAITAKIWGKQGPWTDYPDRMIQLRARSFAIRDLAPDWLNGICIKEEADDYIKDINPNLSHTVRNAKDAKQGMVDDVVDGVIVEEEVEEVNVVDGPYKIELAHPTRIDYLKKLIHTAHYTNSSSTEMEKLIMQKSSVDLLADLLNDQAEHWIKMFEDRIRVHNAKVPKEDMEEIDNLTLGALVESINNDGGADLEED